MIKILKKISQVLFFFFAVLTIAEVILRVQANYSDRGFGDFKGWQYQTQAMRLEVEDKITVLWSKSVDERPNEYWPPFPVFLNTGYDDPERMKLIWENYKLPISNQITIDNFLNSEDVKPFTRFTVTTNSLGFRDPERPIKKPKNVFRIVVLGAYAAFGHGVNDNETYIRRAEKILNESRQPNQKRIEIWNGSRQGATAIMGLARLTNEVMSYEPDLLVWDFGWIEPFLWSDHSGFKGARISNLGKPTAIIARLCFHIRELRLELCNRLKKSIDGVTRDNAIKGFNEVTSRMKKFAIEKSLPVVILRQARTAFPPDIYNPHHDPSKKIWFYDLTDMMRVPPTQMATDDFWSHPNWLSHMGVTRKEIEENAPGMIYLGDAIQYNKWGQEVIADLFAAKVKELLPLIHAD